MTDAYHTAVRLQLLALGYNILPNLDKVCQLPGWNAAVYPFHDSGKGSLTEQAERWPQRFPKFMATGVRLGKGLGAVDLDVDDEAMIDHMIDEIVEIAPAVALRAPMRYGGGAHKVALFVRVEGEAWNRIASKRFTGQDGRVHMVEIFGGAPLRSGKCSRQFGIYGPHSHNEDGTVAREYTWATGGPALHEATIEELPALTLVQAYAIVAAFERLAHSASWAAAEGTDTSAADIVYDITDATRFDTDKGGTDISYAELCEELEAYGDVRCSASFLGAGRGESGKRDRCWVSDKNRHNAVGVYVYGDAQLHLPEELDPARAQPPLPTVPQHPHADAADAADITNSKSAISTSLTIDEPPEPAHDAGLEAQVLWLVQTRAYLEIEHRVVRVYDTSLDCRVTPPAFEMRYRSWFELVQSGKTQKPLYAAKCWEGSPARLNIEGVQMRPDMPFPLFSEAGRAFKNTYRRPVHATEGGEIATFLDFMQRFLPDERERTWLLTWMAHKQARPEIPGSAVIFVADNVKDVREGRFGTGRGLLFRVVHALYGPAYARSQSFNVLDGTSSQSAFNDWMHGSVLVTVDESRTSPTAYRRGERNAVYDVLKDIVDPAPKRVDFKGKYKAAFNGTSFCSFWVATNHADAVAIPAADRRFTVLRNGREITPAEAIAFDAWMVRPENIGALARFLAAIDLTGFNMFDPLVTEAKIEMSELARTEVEEILDGMMGDDTLGLAFTRYHMMERISLNFKYNSVKWAGEFEAAWSRYCVKISGPGGSPRRVRVSGTQRKLFCFRTKKFHVDSMPEAALRREAAKWGLIDGLKTRTAGLVSGTDLSEKSEQDQ